MTTPTNKIESAESEPVVVDDGFLLGFDVGAPEFVAKPVVTEEVAGAESASLVEVVAPTEPVSFDSDAVPMESVQIPDRLYFRIGDVAELAGVKPYVLRYWETEFTMIAPQKSATGQRVYRRIDVETVLLIKHLLYREKYSIEGARKRLQELRRDGGLKTFRQEKLFGGVQAAAQSEKFKDAREAVKELQTLIQLPLRELFRY